MDKTGDMFRDSIAFARSVLRDDVDGMEMILEIYENPLHLLVPQSWILNAAIAKLANELGLTIDETWMLMLSSLDTLEGGALDE